MKIKKISALEILDSRGNPTVEAHVFTESGFHGFGLVPSGASTGSFEAVEIRDGGERFHGKGVQSSVKKIETLIRDALIGTDVRDQDKIDKIMIEIDGSENKRKLGANSTLAVSVAALRAAAAAYSVEPFQYLGGFTADLLPLPMMNIINGGVHATNNLDIQEFMIVPVGSETFSEGVRICTEIYHTLRKKLEKQNYFVAVGDEGGFAPDFKNNEAAIEHIIDAIKCSGYRCGEDVKLALDAASTEWFDGEVYTMPKSVQKFGKEEIINYWDELVHRYPIISIEDPAAEEDWETWQQITRRIKAQIVGDDLFVTQTNRISKGINLKSANAVLIKPNQVGTITETIAAVKLAKASGFGTIISHRSGDTEDSFIADLAVGLGAGQIKTGAPCRSERTAKYNRLLYIEKMLRNSI